jgi:hypothetical protein
MATEQELRRSDGLKEELRRRFYGYVAGTKAIVWLWNRSQYRYCGSGAAARVLDGLAARSYGA